MPLPYHWGREQGSSGNGIHLPYDIKSRNYSIIAGLQSIHTLPFLTKVF